MERLLGISAGMGGLAGGSAAAASRPGMAPRWDATHHVGTDMPYARANGDANSNQYIASIRALGYPPAEKEKMFGANLLRLIGK